MKIDITSRSNASLHAQLFGYVHDEFFDCKSDQGHFWNLDFEKVKNLVRDDAVLKKDSETGLWYYTQDENSFSLLRYQYTNGYFLVYWPPGRVMAQKLADGPQAELIDGKFVLSIGSGSGLAETFLFKKRKPALMACFDNNVFARAATELTAEANDVNVGENFVVIANPQIVEAASAGKKNYRLFDTVLTADCLYGKHIHPAREIYRLAATLKNLNHQGIDVIISDRDEAKSRQLRGGSAKYVKQVERDCGLLKKSIIGHVDFPVDEQYYSAFNAHPKFSHEPVNLYHWPASAAENPLPRLNMKWWQPPAPSQTPSI